MIYINDHLDDFDLEAALPLLSAQRREQTLRFRYESGRRQCAAAYLLLCEALRKEYGITEKPLFEYNEHGKPNLMFSSLHVPFSILHQIHFNISHCSEAAVCIVSDHPVGIDVESIRSYRPSLVSYTMNDAEQRQIAAAERPEVEFIRLWTQKEAVLKLRGTGLRNDMKTVLDDAPFVRTVIHSDYRYIYSVAE